MKKMLKRLYHKLQWINSIKKIDFIYYNYLCKRVLRDKEVYIIPYKGAIIDIHRTAKIELHGQNLNIGINKIGKSRAETYVKMEKEAYWKCNNGASLCYGGNIEIHDNGCLETNSFFLNVGSVIIATKRIELGEDVWIGRDCVIYDSDFHWMLDENGNVRNVSKPVKVGNHVWLTNHVMVQKGVEIGANVVICPHTIVRKNISEGKMIASGTTQICVADDIKWSSELI